MRSIGVLIVRLVVGGLLAGHGAQKLFGSFGGHGLEGTAQWLESLRLRPGRFWARVAGFSELGGGLLTALGALNPLGPIAALGAMLMATFKVHLGKPVWVTQGGAELPVTNIAVMTALMINGPGKLSVDGLLGIRVPRKLGALALLGMLGAVAFGSREELAEGTSDVARGGEEVHGDPATDEREAVAVMDAGATSSAESPSLAGTSVDAPSPSGADMRGADHGVAVATTGMRPTSERDEISESLKTDVERAEAAGTTLQGAELDDQYRVGEAGSDAGTAMGTGSALGSETPEEEI